MRRRDFIKVVAGSAITWPLATRAQQRTMPVIGVLSPATSEADANRMNAIRQGLKDAAVAAKSATNAIPIVFTLGVDPVQLGLVTSFNRPGGNVTGVYGLQLAVAGKRLELLHELVPSAGAIAFLANPKSRSLPEVEAEALRTAGRSLGVELRILNASNSNEIDAAFTTLAKDHSVPLVVSADALFVNQRVQLVVLAARHCHSCNLCIP